MNMRGDRERLGHSAIPSTPFRCHGPAAFYFRRMR
jgi:hypothetical protein